MSKPKVIVTVNESGVPEVMVVGDADADADADADVDVVMLDYCMQDLPGVTVVHEADKIDWRRYNELIQEGIEKLEDSVKEIEQDDDCDEDSHEIKVEIPEWKEDIEFLNEKII